MKTILAVVMVVAIVGLWQLNKRLNAQSEMAVIAAQGHAPFHPASSRPARFVTAAEQPHASQFSPSASAPSHSLAALPPSSAVASPTTDSPFSCDGRTHCSQMRSCEEATFFIQHCPNTKMDGNNDGVPCEQQWCR